MNSYMISEKAMEKKSNYIKTTMRICATNDSLTESQHRALAILATYRHKLHKDKTFYYDDDASKRDKYINFLKNILPIMLHQASLPDLDFSKELEMLVTRNQAESFNNIMFPSGEYFETVAGYIAEQINLRIEDYLGGIDYEYGTSYAPSRLSRYAYASRQIIA